MSGFCTSNSKHDADKFCFFFIRVWNIPQLSSIISFQDAKLSILLHFELAPKFGFSFIVFYAW